MSDNIQKNTIDKYRVSLYVSGCKTGQIEQSMAMGVNNIILCLEDGTPADKKFEARWIVSEALREFSNIGKDLVVRINPIDAELWTEDLKAILPNSPDRIRIPKINHEKDIYLLNDFIEKFSMENNLIKKPKYEIMIESYSAVQKFEQIVSASKDIHAITIGGEDLRADLAANNLPLAKDYVVAKKTITTKSRKMGLLCLDTTFMDYLNTGAFIEDCKASKNMGFHGRSVIHPVQVELAMSVYNQ
ncbi:hypothetical protein KKA47_04855 [bacterium]|nr:hypothetical protein [bacterium]